VQTFYFILEEINGSASESDESFVEDDMNFKDDNADWLTPKKTGVQLHGKHKVYLPVLVFSLDACVLRKQCDC